MDLGIAGKKAIVCASSKGLGRGCAMALAREGANVTINSRNSDVLEATAAEIREAHGVEVTTVAMDVTTPEGRAALLAACPEPDILINNAGGPPPGDFREWDRETWISAIDANMLTAIFLIKDTVDGMIERGFGRIVSFAMANADRMSAQPFVAGHYIAKAGVLMLTRSLARVLGPHGITVNAVSPGFIDSGSAPSEELEQMVGKIPAGYIGELDDAVAATLFFLSDEARYVNGSNLHVSGGWGI